MKKKLWLLASGALMLDILSKLAIIKWLKGSNIKLIPGLLSLTYSENTGAAFSIMEGNALILAAIAVAVIGYVIYSTKKKRIDKLQMWGYALFIGGVIGNLVDRLCYGYVVDFIHFYISKHSFPIFNFADTFIVIGAGLLAIDIIKGEKNENSSRKRK